MNRTANTIMFNDIMRTTGASASAVRIAADAASTDYRDLTPARCARIAERVLVMYPHLLGHTAHTDNPPTPKEATMATKTNARKPAKGRKTDSATTRTAKRANASEPITAAGVARKAGLDPFSFRVFLRGEGIRKGGIKDKAHARRLVAAFNKAAA